MPEYKCQNCGRHFFGWGVKGTCQKCGGKLKEILESETDNLIKKKDKEGDLK
ncbi:hypothetical protein ES707_20882 [subsurface metagenome]